MWPDVLALVSGGGGSEAESAAPAGPWLSGPEAESAARPGPEAESAAPAGPRLSGPEAESAARPGP